MKHIPVFFQQGPQDERKRLKSQEMMIQSARINKIIEVVKGFCVIESCLNSPFASTLQLWMDYN